MIKHFIRVIIIYDKFLVIKKGGDNLSKIKIFALGGLNEDGKNMYVVNVDDDIFVFDAGLKYPRDHMLGIDYIIPNFDYLKEHYKNVKGIFITHGHESNMGALSDIVVELPDIPIYASKFTLEVIKLQFIQDGITKYNLIEESGRMEAPGRPMMYKTTDEFLRLFGYTSLKDMPELPALKEDDGQTELFPEETIQSEE